MKYSFLLMIALFGHCLALAQDCTDLAEKAVYHFQSGDLEKAKRYFDRALPLCRSEFGAGHKHYINLRNVAAYVYEQTGDHGRALELYNDPKKIGSRIAHYYGNDDYETALKYASRTLEICDSIKPSFDPGCVESTMMVAILHQELNDFDKAINYFKNTLIEARIHWDTLETSFADLMADIGFQYQLMTRYTDALVYYKRAVGIYESASDMDTISYYMLLGDLSKIQKEMYQYNEALKQMEKVLLLIEEQYGYANEEYIFTLLDVAGLHKDIGNDSLSLSFYKKAEKLAKAHLEKDHVSLRIAKCNKAQILAVQGKHRSAKELLLELLRDYERIDADRDLYGLAACLDALASVEQELGYYERARHYLMRSMMTTKSIHGTENRSYVGQMKKMGIFFIETGNLDSAYMLYKDAFELLNELEPMDSVYYAIFISDFAGLHARRGDNFQALKFYDAGTEIMKRVLPANHPDLIVHLSNFASFNMQLGRFSDALDLYEKILVYTESRWGKTHEKYADCLTNIGGVYENLEDHEYAMRFFLTALKITGSNLGANHVKYAQRLNNLASSFSKIDSISYLEEACNMYQDARKIALTNFNKLHPDYGRYSQNIGVIYTKLKKYEDALRAFSEAQKTILYNYGQSHTNYRILLINIAGVYKEMGEYNLASIHYTQANDILIEEISRNFSFSTENQKREYYGTLDAKFHGLQSFQFETNQVNLTLNDMLYDNQLILKGLILNSSKDAINLARLKLDQSSLRMLHSLKALKNQLTMSYGMPKTNRTRDVDSLEEIAQRLESSLLKRISDANGRYLTFTTGWIDVRNALDSNEMAIEFSHFKFYRNKWTDSILYVAYVITPKCEHPEMVFLFEKEELESLLKKGGSGYLHGFRNGFEAVGSTGHSEELYKLIWGKLENYLHHSDKVYFSVDGMLNRISMTALKNESAQYLLQEKSMIQMSSTANILEKDDLDRISHMSLFGGIDYEPVAVTAQGNQATTLTSLRQHHQGNNPNSWSPLAWSASEVRDVQQLALKADIATEIQMGHQASEKRLKDMDDNSPHVLHIATHGFCFDDSDTTRLLSQQAGASSYVLAKDPLFRSGLVMAGANYAWTGGEVGQQVEDGILTAYEISHLDLSNTQLVVLSACQTGLGEIEGSEGVYGLQRAFKMAGVNYIIMSLWNVPDQETSELMIDFYSNWLEKEMSLSEAFYSAQKTMATNYPNKPELWAGFVLMQ